MIYFLKFELALWVKIIHRANNRIIGRYESSKNFGFVVPDDNRITKDIFIPKKYITAKCCVISLFVSRYFTSYLHKSLVEWEKM